MQHYQEMMQDTFDQITQIGAGGGGVVFKAHHKRLDKEVVLKKIHTSQLKNINRRGELDILKNLKHNYIPQMLDFIEYGNDVFTVMEYIPGQSFAQLLDQGKKFQQKDVVKWMRQLCEVVHYLHSQKTPIIHCDIKPANVMLTPAGDICLIDFNISGVKTEEGIESIGYSNGYAPVEQFAVVARRLGKVSRRGHDSVDGEKNIYGINLDEGLDIQEERTEVISGHDREGTEIASSEAEERTETVSHIKEESTEITAERGEESTEIVLCNGEECTEVVSAVVEEYAEAAFCNEESTEIISGGAKECTEAVPYNKEEYTKATKSPMRSLKDEEWVAARQVEKSVGKNLMVDERTDIYSIGATVYHILTGRRPQPFYLEQISVSRAKEDVNEGLAYVIEKAMALQPAKRFKSSAQMLKIAQNMGTVDRRYKALYRKQFFSGILTGTLAAISLGLTVWGRNTMEQEKAEQYITCIEAMKTARAEQDYEAVFAEYGKALEFSEEQQDAYYEAGMAYYEQKRYEECIDFLNQNVYSNAQVLSDSNYGRFYYITGSCYFELEEYDQAVACYTKAVEMQPEEISYYRDYVVALARNGALEEAEQVLERAEAKGISADALNLLNGEISLLRSNYEECERYFSDCILGTEDSYLLLRAYTKLDDAYRLMYEGNLQHEKRIGLLTDALAALPADSQVTLMERLAQVYIDYSDTGDRDDCCTKAIAIFGQMEERGYATFTSRYNIVVLYEKMGKYGEAQSCLDAMLDLYEDNYIVYKRRAFLELEIQAEKSHGERDYHVFQKFYMQALELYQENADREDMEMLSLQQLYRDVVTNGWL